MVVSLKEIFGAFLHPNAGGLGLLGLVDEGCGIAYRVALANISVLGGRRDMVFGMK